MFVVVASGSQNGHTTSGGQVMDNDSAVQPQASQSQLDYQYDVIAQTPAVQAASAPQSGTVIAAALSSQIIIGSQSGQQRSVFAVGIF